MLHLIQINILRLCDANFVKTLGTKSECDNVKRGTVVKIKHEFDLKFMENTVMKVEQVAV